MTHSGTRLAAFHESRSFSTAFAKSGRDWAFTFCMIRARSTLMVFSMVPNLEAITLFGRPPATKGITSRSRRLLLWRHTVERLGGIKKVIQDEPQAARVVEKGEREDDGKRHPEGELLVDG